MKVSISQCYTFYFNINSSNSKHWKYFGSYSKYLLVLEKWVFFVPTTKHFTIFGVSDVCMRMCMLLCDVKLIEPNEMKQQIKYLTSRKVRERKNSYAGCRCRSQLFSISFILLSFVAILWECVCVCECRERKRERVSLRSMTSVFRVVVASNFSQIHFEMATGKKTNEIKSLRTMRENRKRSECFKIEAEEIMQKERVLVALK